MRTLTSTLNAAQKLARLPVLARIVLTKTGQATQTYTTSRILDLNHIEEPHNQEAEVLLNNSDGALTSLDLRGYKGVISYGITTSAGAEYSACAPLWVTTQNLVSAQGYLACRLGLIGTPNLLAEDRANAVNVPSSADAKTVKDILKAIAAGGFTAWAGTTAYVLHNYVKPTVANGFAYECTTAGTSAAGQPTWPIIIGTTVTDGTVVWTCRGKDITSYSHCSAYTLTFDREDTLIDVYAPAHYFQIELNGTRLDTIQRLLGFTKCVMRVEANEAIHIFQPTISDTSNTWAANIAYALNAIVIPTTPNNYQYKCTTAGTSHATTEPAWPTAIGSTVTDNTVVWTVSYNYEYSLASGFHTFYSKGYQHCLIMPNYIVVSTPPDETTIYIGYAEDTANAGGIQKREYRWGNVASNAQATAIATAILSQYQIAAQQGATTVPLNVGAEVYDLIKLTDARQGDYRLGNIGYLGRHYKSGGTWEMNLQFGTDVTPSLVDITKDLVAEKPYEMLFNGSVHTPTAIGWRGIPDITDSTTYATFSNIFYRYDKLWMYFIGQTWAYERVVGFELSIWSPITAPPSAKTSGSHGMYESGVIAITINGKAAIGFYNMDSHTWTSSSAPPQIGGVDTDIHSLCWASSDTLWAWCNKQGTNVWQVMRYVKSTNTWTQYANTFSPSYATVANIPGAVYYNGNVYALYWAAGGTIVYLKYVIATDTYSESATHAACVTCGGGSNVYIPYLSTATSGRLGYFNATDESWHDDYFLANTTCPDPYGMSSISTDLQWAIQWGQGSSPQWFDTQVSGFEQLWSGTLEIGTIVIIEKPGDGYAVSLSCTGASGTFASFTTSSSYMIPKTGIWTFTYPIAGAYTELKIRCLRPST